MRGSNYCTTLFEIRAEPFPCTALTNCGSQNEQPVLPWTIIIASVFIAATKCIFSEVVAEFVNFIYLYMTVGLQMFKLASYKQRDRAEIIEKHIKYLSSSYFRFLYICFSFHCMWQLSWTKYAAVNDYNRCGSICTPIRAWSLLVKVPTFLRDSNEWMFVSCNEFNLALRDFLRRRKCCKSRSPCSYQLVVNLSLIGLFPFFIFLFLQFSSFFLTLQPKSSLAPLCCTNSPNPYWGHQWPWTGNQKDCIRNKGTGKAVWLPVSDWNEWLFILTWTRPLYLKAVFAFLNEELNFKF